MGSGLVVPFAISLVMLGCCSNVVFLELLIREDPGSGNIITFTQFLFVALEGVVFVPHFLKMKPVIPMRNYMLMVALFFMVSVVNNYALNFNIPMPLHMIFRAGSLMANMILSVIILRKTYPLSKYVAVLMITLGISMATIESANQIQQSNNSASNHTDTSNPSEHTSVYAATSDVFRLFIGIAMLVFAMFTSAMLGIVQEVTFGTYGKYPRESMFYMHLLPLPGFLLLGSDIWNKVLTFSVSEPVSLGVVSLPKMWAYIIGNCFTQYVCIKGVYILATECPSLVVTLIITLRKFLSLLFSIFYFQNPFTLYHWLATLMVFTGTALFAGVLHPVAQRLGIIAPEKPKKE